MIIDLLGIVIVYEGILQLAETCERHEYWDIAREYCNRVGKPLLRIGVKRSIFEPPNGDVTLDIDPVIIQIKGGVQGDERMMPFKDKEFGMCFNEHTLEHLYEPKDVELAVNECVRVADYAILLAPSPYSIHSTLFCSRSSNSHNLRLWFEDGKIKVAKNTFKTGLGFDAQPAIGRIGQVMIVDKAPQVVCIGKGYIINDF